MLAFLFVVAAVAVRFLPHTFHFTPVGASLLFFGAKQSRKWLWFPVAAFAVSDVLLNRYIYHYPITWETFVSTGWYVLAVLIGSLLKKYGDRFQIGYVAGAALAGSVSFFIISNFAVWMGGQMYPMTLAGLADCYVKALPFFNHTLESDALFTGIFFATPALLRMLNARKSAAAAA